MGRRLTRSLAVLVVVAIGLVGSLAAVASAGGGNSGSSGSGSGGGSSKEVLATLQVENPKVEVKKKGADAFKTAKDGQKLREGDTVRTDATGRAEIDYGDDAYTRLDVNTTFTITKLTEEEGARQVEGSLDTGRTWNRTEAVTESGSFEQSAGGATAAVAGTAFMWTCVTSTSCSLISADSTVVMESDENGELRFVPQNGLCSSDDGDLCDETRILTDDEMAAIAWIQENLLRDLLEHGFGTGPIIPSFTIVVEGGQVVSVVQNPPPAPLLLTATTSSTTSSSSTSSSTTSSSTTTSSTTTTTTDPPAIEDPPINVEGGGSNGTGEGDPGITVPTGPQSGIVTEDETADPDLLDNGNDNLVTFTVNVTGPDGHTLSIKFTELPGGEFGAIQWNNDGTWEAVTQTDVDDGTLFPEATQFRFDPVQYEPHSSCNEAAPTSVQPLDFPFCFTDADYPNNVVNNQDGTVSWTTSFKVVAVDETTNQTSPEVSVPIEIIDDTCSEQPDRIACYLVEEPGAEVLTVATVTTTTNATTTTTNATTTTEATTTPSTEEPTTSSTEETTTSTTGS